MNTQHTQGPWYLEGHSHKLGYVVSAELRDSDPVAFVKNNHNARLIAAAPDLLEALQGMLLGFSLTQNPDAYPSDAPCNKARAAIAKATGAA